MFTQIGSLQCTDNPNTDRSAPPPSKKADKKKGGKKAGKKH
jgi:hypothetical protein